jgi:hypothetical protein
MRVRLVAIVVWLTVLAGPLLAHHSPSSEFDAKATITLRGAITKLEWANPHVWIYMDAKGPDGKLAHWAVESSSPNSLEKSNVDKHLFVIGAQVTVEGWAAKKGGHQVGGQTMTLPGGRKLDIHDRWLESGNILRPSVPLIPTR